MGMFPVSQEKLLKLAALRLQYLDGDCTPGSTMYVYCLHILWGGTCTLRIYICGLFYSSVIYLCVYV